MTSRGSEGQGLTRDDLHYAFQKATGGTDTVMVNRRTKEEADRTAETMRRMIAGGVY